MNHYHPDQSLRQPDQNSAEYLPPGLFAETVFQAPIAISITDDQANIIYVNQAFTEITGYCPSESLGHNESMLSDKKTPRAVYRELWGHLQRQLPWRGRMLNRHRDGHAYLAELTVAPILNAARKTTHYLGMHRDVTEIHQLQQRAIDQKRLIEAMVDSMPMAALLMDETGRVVLDNLAYKKLDSDLGLRKPSTMFLSALQDEFGEEWERLKRQGGGFRNREIRYERGGRHGPRWFACSGTWFKQADDRVDAVFEEDLKTYLLLMVDDITHQKEQEAELRMNALQALMAEEEKIQSLRETLLCAMQHIQEPINLLRAAQKLLQRRQQRQDHPALADILDQILAAGESSLERLRACVPEMEESARRPVNINQLLHESLLLLTQALLAAGVIVDWRPTPVLPPVVGIETRLRALFKQLLENAIDAMNQSGIVTRELKVATWADGELVHVLIEDTGPGIPDALSLKIFEPFFSTKHTRSRRHQGMGLTMAQEVVNQHGGLLQFDSSDRQGCRVHLQFLTSARQAHSQDCCAHG